MRQELCWSYFQEGEADVPAEYADIKKNQLGNELKYWRPCEDCEEWWSLLNIELDSPVGIITASLSEDHDRDQQLMTYTDGDGAEQSLVIPFECEHQLPPEGQRLVEDEEVVVDDGGDGDDAGSGAGGENAGDGDAGGDASGGDAQADAGDGNRR